VTTHAEPLARALEKGAGTSTVQLIKDDGATVVVED